MKEERLRFTIEHSDWSLEDWKAVIWTDETSVVLGQHRGKRRVWKKRAEYVAPSVVRRRWKKASEFMFWGSFSYDKKGPCHIWSPETKKEKDIATKDLKLINEKLEPKAKEAWELENGMRWLGLKGKGGPKPKWKFDKDHGKVTRGGKGGIEIVQEDKAPAYASHYQHQVFLDWNIARIL